MSVTSCLTNCNNSCSLKLLQHCSAVLSRQWTHLHLVKTEWTCARCTNTKLVLCFANTESWHFSLHNETCYAFVTLKHNFHIFSLLHMKSIYTRQRSGLCHNKDSQYQQNINDRNNTLQWSKTLTLKKQLLQRNCIKMLKMLKTDLYSAKKSEDSKALNSKTSELGSQRGFGGIEMCWGCF